MLKRLSTMRESRVQSLGWEDPLEKEMAIHSSNIAWKIPWTEEPGRLQSMGLQRVGHNSGFTQGGTSGVTVVENLSAKQEMQVQSLGQEDPLEKGPAIHPSILAWRIPWIEEPGGPQSMVLQRVRHDQATNTETSTVEHGTFLSTKSDISPDCADDK